jgi:hypothetical protein
MTLAYAPIQKQSAGLTVSHPHDTAEFQAERVADIAMQGGSLPSWSFGSVALRAPVQRLDADRSDTAPTSELIGLDLDGVARVLNSAGNPLDPELREPLEARLGYDFSRVRLHDDFRSHAAAKDIGARAFAVGEHIGFAVGRPAFSTEEGRHLLVHELAHVVQHAANAADSVHRQTTSAATSDGRSGRRRYVDELDDRARRTAMFSADPGDVIYHHTWSKASRLSDDELLQEIIDREDAVSNQSNPVLDVELKAMQNVQYMRKLAAREGPPSVSYTVRQRAKDLSVDELDREIERVVAEHARGPSTSTEEEYLALKAERNVRARRLLDPGAKAEETDTPDMTDRAVKLKDRSRELLDSAQKWSGRGAMLPGRSGEVLKRFNAHVAKWNAIVKKIDRLEDAELAYDLCHSFSRFAETDPMDSEALATAAGEAFDVVGQLMEKTKIPLVRDYGQLLRSTRHFFADMRRIMDPATNLLSKHPTYAPYMTELGGPE